MEKFISHILLTLPLSGRQRDQGGEAERCWWPDHSKGLFGIRPKREDYILPANLPHSKLMHNHLLASLCIENLYSVNLKGLSIYHLF